MALLANGDVVAINAATQLLDLFPISDPTEHFAVTSLNETPSDAPRTVVLTNVGLSDATAETHSISDLYDISDTCNTGLRFGGSCLFAAILTPTHLDANGGSVTMTFGGASPSQTPFIVDYDVTGIEAASLTHTSNSPAMAGVVQTQITTAIGSNGVKYTGYDATVHYTSSDASAVLPAGNAWVSNATGASVTWLAPLGAGASNFTGGGLNLPSSIAIDGVGNVWVTNKGNNIVTELSGAGVAVSPAAGFTGAGINQPTGIAISAQWWSPSLACSGFLARPTHREKQRRDEWGTSCRYGPVGSVVSSD